MKTENEHGGTFIGVKFHEDTIDKLKQFIADNNIPNPVSPENLHTTIIYNTLPIDIEPIGILKLGHKGFNPTIEKWETQPDKNGETTWCLVVSYECDSLQQRHEYLTTQHNISYDFEDYKPHVTLSYNIPVDLDTKSLTDIKKYINIIIVTEEYKNVCENC